MLTSSGKGLGAGDAGGLGADEGGGAGSVTMVEAQSA